MIVQIADRIPAVDPGPGFLWGRLRTRVRFQGVPTEPCVLRTFGHDGKLNTCAQSVPKKFRDILRADENQWKVDTPKRAQYAQSDFRGVPREKRVQY
eukprot:COSAG02_NODE_249_length_27097_cov_30.179155_9_plen_97_part_00